MIERGPGGDGVTVNDVVEAIYRRLCDHQRRQGVLAGMSLAELRLALGVRAEQFDEAVRMAEQAFIAELSKLVNHLVERLAGGGNGERSV